MALNFSPAPLSAPLVGANGLVSVSWLGYFTQYDQLTPGIVLGRASNVAVGPPQQLSGSAGTTATGLTLALTAGGTSVTFDLVDGRLVNAVVTP